MAKKFGLMQLLAFLWLKKFPRKIVNENIFVNKVWHLHLCDFI
jgi:hypothetical protein